MVVLLQSGDYKLIETKQKHIVLYLDDKCYVWVNAQGVGEILVTSHKAHKVGALLSSGEYNIYSVRGEPYLNDQRHLELEAGFNQWQGYLLPTGLPDDIKTRSRIIPTTERITTNPYVKIAYAHNSTDENSVASKGLFTW